MSYLFDTDAISELLRRAPLAKYVSWIQSVPREHQFTSAVSMAELYYGAWRSGARDRHVDNIENRVLPAVTVLLFDVGTAAVYGRVRAELEASGLRLDDLDLQIAATAIRHDLELVTGNLQHFERVPGLRVNRVLAEARH